MTNEMTLNISPQFLASWTYGDIFLKGRPQHHQDEFSRTHPRMSRGKRAKIFAPFAALAGYGEAVAAKEIVYEPKKELAEEKKTKINQQLSWIEEHTPRSEKERLRTGAEGPQIQVTFFQQNVLPIDRTLAVNGDTENGKLLDDGRPRGQYRSLKGSVHRISLQEQCMEIRDGATMKQIAFDDVWEITCYNGIQNV